MKSSFSKKKKKKEKKKKRGGVKVRILAIPEVDFFAGNSFLIEPVEFKKKKNLSDELQGS